MIAAGKKKEVKKNQKCLLIFPDREMILETLRGDPAVLNSSFSFMDQFSPTDGNSEETPKIKSPSLMIPARVPVGKYNGKNMTV